MRALLTGFGTLGDLQPLLALGVELQRGGHEPLIAFGPAYSDRVRAAGLPFSPLGPDLSETQREVNRLMNEIAVETDAIRAAWSPLVSALPAVYEELLEVSRAADVLICGPGLPAGRMVHETTAIPFVSVQVANFGGTGSSALRDASRALINPVREEYRLPPLSDPLTLDANSPQLALYAMSRHLRPPSADWPGHVHVTGFFFLDETWAPPAELESFLAAGPAPVAVSFGSTVQDNPEAVREMAIEAAASLGARVVLQEGDKVLCRDAFHREIHPMSYVPHGWLLPRCALAVHHGGAGTTAAALRAGIPSVAVLHSAVGDQPYWAHLLQGAGCAPAPIPFSELRADRLTEALRCALSAGCRRRAADLGRAVEQEAGVQKARRLIEELVDRLGLERNGARDIEETRAPSRTERLGRRLRYRRERQNRKPGRLDAAEGERRTVPTPMAARDHTYAAWETD